MPQFIAGVEHCYFQYAITNRHHWIIYVQSYDLFQTVETSISRKDGNPVAPKTSLILMLQKSRYMGW